MEKNEAFLIFARRNGNFQHDRDAAQKAWHFLSEEDQAQLNEWIVGDFSEALVAVTVAAKQEQAKILSDYHFPENKFQYSPTDWHTVIDAYKGSKYEKLHFAALFGYSDHDAHFAFAREFLFEDATA